MKSEDKHHWTVGDPKGIQASLNLCDNTRKGVAWHVGTCVGERVNCLDCWELYPLALLETLDI